MRRRLPLRPSMPQWEADEMYYPLFVIVVSLVAAAVGLAFVVEGAW